MCSGDSLCSLPSFRSFDGGRWQLSGALRLKWRMVPCAGRMLGAAPRFGGSVGRPGRRPGRAGRRHPEPRLRLRFPRRIECTNSWQDCRPMPLRWRGVICGIRRWIGRRGWDRCRSCGRLAWAAQCRVTGWQHDIPLRIGSRLAKTTKTLGFPPPSREPNRGHPFALSGPAAGTPRFRWAAIYAGKSGFYAYPARPV